MAEHLRPIDTGLSQALGRIPSGLYILTVAIRGDRHVADWVAASGKFTLSQLAVGSKALIRHFGRGFPPDAPAFEGLALRHEARGGPILAAAMAYLDAEVAGELATGDH